MGREGRNVRVDRDKSEGKPATYSTVQLWLLSVYVVTVCDLIPTSVFLVFANIMLVVEMKSKDIIIDNTVVS